MKNLIICIIVQFGLFILFYLMIENKKEKIVFVKLEKVYEEFQLKKELEKKFKNIETKRMAILDSLEFELKLYSKKLEEVKSDNKNLLNEYETKKELYFMKKQQFTEDNKAVMDQYHTQIITKLNEYVSAFGKIKNYGYILGTDGSGSLMYSEEKNDVTTEVIKYINSNYKEN